MNNPLIEAIEYRLYENEMGKIISECQEKGIDIDQLTEQQLNELFGGLRQRFGNAMRGQGFKTDKDALHAHRMKHDKVYSTQQNTQSALNKRQGAIERLKARGGNIAAAANKMNPNVVKKFDSGKGKVTTLGGKKLAKALNPYQAGNRETRPAGHPGGSTGQGRFRSEAGIEAASERNRSRAARRADLQRQGKLRRDPNDFKMESITNRITSILLEMRLNNKKVS